MRTPKLWFVFIAVLLSALVMFTNIFWLLHPKANSNTFLWLNVSGALLFLLVAVFAFSQKNK